MIIGYAYHSVSGFDDLITDNPLLEYINMPHSFWLLCSISLMNIFWPFFFFFWEYIHLLNVQWKKRGPKIEEATGEGLGGEMSLGWVAIGSLRIQRKGAMETGSGVLLPAVLPVASPIVAPKGFFFLSICPREGHRYTPRRVLFLPTLNKFLVDFS